MLRVDSLSCSYGTAQILAGVDLHVAEGEVVALLGRNGMGKTSLVRCVFGMTPPRVTTGTVQFRGKDLTGVSSHKIAQHGLALVPQGRRVFGSLTVRENLTVTGTNPGDWTVEKVFDFFPQLRNRANSRAGNLSGGEQQMLAIGRALVKNPRLVVMDEPSEGLAPIVLRDIRDRLQPLKATGLTALIVEQNVGMALALADRVYILGGRGSIVWTGTSDEFLNSPEIQRRHLGV